MHNAYPVIHAEAAARADCPRFRRPSTQIGRMNQPDILLIPVPHLDTIMSHAVGQYAGLHLSVSCLGQDRHTESPFPRQFHES